MQFSDILFEYDPKLPPFPTDFRKAVNDFVKGLSPDQLNRALDFYAFVYNKGALLDKIRDSYNGWYTRGNYGNSTPVRMYDFFRA